MTQPLFLRLALGFATLACVACLPAAASAVEINDVFEFKGTVTDIGVQRGPGQIGGIEYRIEGKFEYDGPLDLTRSTMTFHTLFDEYLPGGNGEMVLTTDNADLVCPEPSRRLCAPTLAPLVSANSSKSDRGQVRDAGPVPAADARADQEQERGVPVQRPARPGHLASGAAARGADRRAPPSRGSSVPAALRRRSSRQEQAREDGHPDQLHDRRRREPAGRARLREGLGVRSARPLPPPVALSDHLERSNSGRSRRAARALSAAGGECVDGLARRSPPSRAPWHTEAMAETTETTDKSELLKELRIDRSAPRRSRSRARMLGTLAARRRCSWPAGLCLVRRAAGAADGAGRGGSGCRGRARAPCSTRAAT